MIDKLAGLPTQIRQLEKRLKEMDASKVKPALVKEITDTIKNLKDMLKEKQDKREQRKKDKEEKAQEVEAAPVGAAPAMGATAPNGVPANTPGQPEATPTTPDDQKISCPLCGGMTFNDQGAYQQHMEFTHASDIMPTSPAQKLDKTVAAVDPVVNKVETDPKIAPGIIVPDSVKKHDEIVDKVEQDPKIAPHIVSEQGPQFKLDDVVMPIRGSESKGKVMRWDGKPNDLVYVMWESGPLKDRDTFGGYYPHDLKADVPPAPVEAAITTDEPVCEKCVVMQEKHGDLKTNYEALLKDLQEERDIHYTQGNNAWVARLDQKIEDLKNAIAEKFPAETGAIDKVNFPNGLSKDAIGGPEFIRKIDTAVSGHGYVGTEYNMTNGTFKRYSAEEGSTHAPLGIGQTKVRKREYPKGQSGYEVKFGGMDWRPVTEGEFNRYFIAWQELNAKRPQKESAAENAQELTIMDHTPPRANSGPDAGGKDSHDEFQDEWALPAGIELQSKLPPKKQRELDQMVQQAVYGYQINMMDMSKVYQAGEAAYIAGQDVTAAVKAFLDSMVAAGKASKTAALEAQPMKLNVLKRELLATPANGGYDISHDGKKLFNIKGKEGKPMSQKQLEFCAQIEFTRGMKQAKLVEKIANLEAGSTVFIMAHDKTTRRVKFASLEHGYRGWASASKFAYLTKKADPMRHGDHTDDVLGSSKSAYLTECPQGSGNMRWIQGSELLPTAQPPATPESLNDLESAKTVKCICGDRQDQHANGGACSACKCPKWSLDKEPATRTVKPMPADKVKRANIDFPLAYFTRPETKERADMFGLIDCEDGDLTPAGLAAKKQEMIEGHDIEAATGNSLVKEFKTKHPSYNGWMFDYEYPGYYVFYSKDGLKNVYFTPDFNEKGVVDVQIIDAEGEHIGGEDIPYKAPLTADTLFAIVKPFLDQDGSQKEALQPALPKAIVPQRGDVNTTVDPVNGPSDADVQQKAYEMFGAHWDALGSKEQDEVYKALGVTSSLKVKAYEQNYDLYEDDEEGTGIEPGDLVDFGAYGQMYVVSLAGRSSRVTDLPEERFNPNAPGWYFNVSGNEPIIEKGSSVQHDVEASLNKIARVVEREDGWHVLSEKGKNLGGPYKSKAQAVKRLRQVEYFKHHGATRPFGRKVVADAMVDPYESLTNHITDMRSRMTQVQDKIQTVPAIKTAGEDNTKMDLPVLFEDITHGVALLEDKLGGDTKADPAIHKMVEELENKLWKLEEECGITPKLNEHEKAEPEHKEIVEDIEKKAARPDPDDINNPDSPGYESEEDDLMDNFVQLKNGQFALVQSHNEGGMIEVDLLGKTENGYKYVTESAIPVPVSAVKRILEWDEIQALKIEHEPWPSATPEVKEADQVTDETITTNDPNAIIDPTNPLSPEQAAAAVPTPQNVQPTDDDNLEVPVVAPTSPAPTGQKWVFDTQFNKYVLMPDPAAPGKQI